MNKLILQGNLGADAVVLVANGREFISFKVADSDKWTGADNVEHSSTTWVSCAWNTASRALLPYLKAGVSVLVIGRMSARVYSSAKERAMVAGINVAVDSVTLVGGQRDDVPARLYDDSGVEYRVDKTYHVDNLSNVVLFNRRKDKQYNVDNSGCVRPDQEQADEPTNNVANANDNVPF